MFLSPFFRTHTALAQVAEATEQLQIMRPATSALAQWLDVVDVKPAFAMLGYALAAGGALLALFGVQGRDVLIGEGTASARLSGSSDNGPVATVLSGLFKSGGISLATFCKMSGLFAIRKKVPSDCSICPELRHPGSVSFPDCLSILCGILFHFIWILSLVSGTILSVLFPIGDGPLLSVCFQFIRSHAVPLFWDSISSAPGRAPLSVIGEVEFLVLFNPSLLARSISGLLFSTADQLLWIGFTPPLLTGGVLGSSLWSYGRIFIQSETAALSALGVDLCSILSAVALKAVQAVTWLFCHSASSRSAGSDPAVLERPSSFDTRGRAQASLVFPSLEVLA